MSDEDPNILTGENPSSTPLDLLLNAISGSDRQYTYNGQDGLATDVDLAFLTEDVSNEAAASSSRKGNAMGSLSSPRHSKISRNLAAHLVSSSIGSDKRTPDADFGLMSKIEVWHPRTAQKSYGKERRMLNPPPTIRVTGPILPLLTQVTLNSTCPSSASSSKVSQRPTDKITISSQSHRIPLHVTDPDPEQTFGTDKQARKAEREEYHRKMRESAAKVGFGGSLPWERRKLLSRERQDLKDGLIFPGLWVGDAVKKVKEFELELKIGYPGMESGTRREVLDQSLTVDGQGDKTAGSEEHMPGSFLGGQLHDLSAIIDTNTLDSLSAGNLAESKTAIDPPIPLDSSSIPQEGVDFDQQMGPSNEVWATLTSGPLIIVSKPSQKTPKARSLETCLTQNDAVSLFVRINSQTVRTRYLKVDENEAGSRLTARTGKWSPFRFEIVSRAIPPPQPKTERSNRMELHQDEPPQMLTYGSIVILVDLQSGLRSEPVKLVKIEKNEAIIGAYNGHPVSELQRVGFARVVNGDDFIDGERWYLSAPSARAGGGELLDPEFQKAPGRARPSRSKDNNLEGAKDEVNETRLQDIATLDDVAQTQWLETGDDSKGRVEAGDAEIDKAFDLLHASAGNSEEEPMAAEASRPRKRRKTKRNALALATLAEEDGSGEQNALRWIKAESEEKEVELEDGKDVRKAVMTVDTVADWMCYVVTGVSSFSYTFFDGLHEGESLPNLEKPLDPVPRALTEPKFNSASNTLDLVVTDRFVDSEPVEVFLGPIGPLPFTTYRSTAPPESVSRSMDGVYQALPYASNGEGSTEDERQVFSAFSSSIPHVIMVVEMPNPEEIIRVMRECAALKGDQSIEDPPKGGNEGSRTEEADIPWVEKGDEMTIQEALKNAEDALDLAETQALDQALDDSAAIDPALQTFGAADAEDLAVTTTNPAAENQQEPQDPEVSRALDEAMNLETSSGLEVGALMPPREEKRVEFVPLPVLLLRKSDGVGFGVGRSVVAERLDNTDEEFTMQPRWGLRVVVS